MFQTAFYVPEFIPNLSSLANKVRENYSYSNEKRPVSGGTVCAENW